LLSAALPATTATMTAIKAFAQKAIRSLILDSPRVWSNISGRPWCVAVLVFAVSAEAAISSSVEASFRDET
jgi:hypothetical protein